MTKLNQYERRVGDCVAHNVVDNARARDVGAIDTTDWNPNFSSYCSLYVGSNELIHAFVSELHSEETTSVRAGTLLHCLPFAPTRQCKFGFDETLARQRAIGTQRK